MAKQPAQSTLALHAGYNFDTQRTMSVPIYQNTAYSFETLKQGADRFALKELGNIYSRLTNPTCDVLGARIAAVEGGAFGVPTASGSAAIFYAVLNCAQNGDNIAYANKIYGGTQTLFVHTLKRFGIQARVFDIDDIENSLPKVIDANTKAIFFESISNPQISVADSEKIVKIARENKIITICDNTVATPYIHRPFDFGVDVVVHSLSKYVNGAGSALGGAIAERNGLNELIKDNARYPAFNTPDESYHGLIYASLPLPFFCIRIITEWLRNTGATLGPHAAWLMIQGLENLELRIARHSESTLKIAQFLESHPKVREVSYPGLKSNKYYALAQKYCKGGAASGLLSFEAESETAAQRICNDLELFEVVVNIGDSKSLVVHPASTTHSQLSENELKSAGITPCTVRLSVGLEDAQDLIDDLKNALDK